jgi:hypothetical protein
MADTKDFSLKLLEHFVWTEAILETSLEKLIWLEWITACVDGRAEGRRYRKAIKLKQQLDEVVRGLEKDVLRIISDRPDASGQEDTCS